MSARSLIEAPERYPTRFHLSRLSASSIILRLATSLGDSQMAVAKDSRKTGYRILLGVVVLLLGASMLLYLVPQSPTTGEASSTDTVAKVGDETVSAAE